MVPPGQIYKQKLPERLTDKVRDFSTKKPRERLEIIQKGVKGGQGNEAAPVGSITHNLA